MPEEKHSFAGAEIHYANFKLNADNNVMLRLLLHNQARVMKKLKIKQEFPTEVYKDLEELMITDKEEIRPENNIERLYQMLKAKIWNWVKLKVDIKYVDPDQENEDKDN